MLIATSSSFKLFKYAILNLLWGVGVDTRVFIYEIDINSLSSILSSALLLLDMFIIFLIVSAALLSIKSIFFDVLVSSKHDTDL